MTSILAMMFHALCYADCWFSPSARRTSLRNGCGSKALLFGRVVDLALDPRAVSALTEIIGQGMPART